MLVDIVARSLTTRTQYPDSHTLRLTVLHNALSVLVFMRRILERGWALHAHAVRQT